MMKITRLIVSSALLAAMAACGGGSGGGGSTPPPPLVSTSYSVTLTGVEIDRTADQDDIMVDGLPVDGATVTVGD